MDSFGSAFALWAKAELYLFSLHFLPELFTTSLPYSLSPSGRKLEISVNIVARTLKFYIEYPWTESVRFRTNQLGGPCGAHVSAIKGPGFGYFYCIFASTCLKCLKFLLKSCERPTEKYPVMMNYWDHVGAMFGPFWTLFGLALIAD